MPFVKLDLTPGITKEMTNYANQGGWWDCDKIRFRFGKPEKIKGWERFTSTAMIGTCRALLRFTDLLNNIYTACGTNQRVYLEFGQALYEITPWRKQSILTNPFDTTISSDQVKVTDTNHGVVIGDRIEISGATAVGGIAAADLNGIRIVSSVISANEYNFTAGAAATSTANGGGSVTIQYIIQDGIDEVAFGTGWGTDGWGDGGWGDPGSPVLGQDTLRIWSFDTFGEDLVMCASDFGIYYWDATSGRSARAFPVDQLANADGAPTVARRVVVSDRDRHVIAFGTDALDSNGAQDPLLIRWSDQENAADWRPSTTNTAGSIRISSGSGIITAIQTRQEVVFWTDLSMHAMRFIGGEYTFGTDILANNVSIAGQNAMTAVADQVFWMGKGAFYTYTGHVQQIPCSVEEYVFNDINLAQSDKIFCSTNVRETEIIWFYPSSSATEIDRYVIFNWRENVWYIGTMDRTSWIDRGINSTPIAADSSGYLYYHETGNSDGSTNPPSQINAYIESSPLEIETGERFSFLKRVIPDVTFRDSTTATPKIDMVLMARNAPGAAILDTETDPLSRTAISPVEQFTEEVWVRLRGRSFVLRFQDTGDIAEAETTWRVGSPRVEIRTDGRR